MTTRPVRAYCVGALALLFCLAALPDAARGEMRYEAEDWTTPTDAWRVDRTSKDKWNLWSKDSDAKLKWSKGVVLQSPLVLADRERPEDSAPPLHTRITGIPNGWYMVQLTTVGRGLAISFDGKTWKRQMSRSLGRFEITNGTFEFWVDDRYALAASPGSTYYDAIVLTPMLEVADGLPNAGFESGEGDRIANWTFYSRNGKGRAVLAQDDRHDGRRCVRVQNDGERDWALTHGATIVVRPKQILTVSAWVRSEAGERTTLAVVAHGGKAFRSRTIGSAFIPAKCGWTRIHQSVRVPHGADAVQVRFTGRGLTRHWLDSVALTPGMPPRASKPLVKGHATTRVTERLGRGLVAMPTEGGRVYVGWRLLADDPADAAFNVYRRPSGGEFKRLNADPIRQTTDFVDATCKPGGAYEYVVRPVVGGKEGAPSRAARATPAASPKPFLSVKLDGDHLFQKVGIGDLDGDGRYDFVIKQPSKNIDPAGSYWYKSPDTYKLEAYSADGKFLWRHDLGWAIERGIWYSPYVVHDLDGDGKAEVAVKTGEGDPRGEDGRVRTGPEYLSILDGMTGKERCKVAWPSRDEYRSYNLASRNQLCIAYLDGKTPCVLVERGTYNLIQVVAYELHDGRLRQLWWWDNRKEPGWYRAQGAHIMHAADVDADGRDEVIIGSAVIDDNGVGLWSTGFGHPDYCFVGDIDPARPGLEVFYGIEPRRPDSALCLVDARTGKVIWALQEPTNHVGSDGMCADIDVAHPGLECHANDIDRKRKFAKSWIFSAAGELISTEERGGMARVVYWDADVQKELVRGSRIVDFRGGRHAPRIEGRVVTFADILGDWREEILVSHAGELRIYTTTIPAVDRRVCLMQDPIYRIDVAVAAMGYWGAPMLSYCPASDQPGLSFRFEQETLEPKGATRGEVVIVAPAKHALVGKLTVMADGAALTPTASTAVNVAAGRIQKVPITLTLDRTPQPLAARASVRLNAVLQASQGADTLQARTAIPVADVPVTGVPMAQAEALAGQGGGEVQVRDDKLGSVGQAISHWDDKGHWLEWKLTAPTAGRYHLVVRYCAPHTAIRELLVDGSAAEGPKSLRFPASGGFGGAQARHWAHWPARDSKGRPAVWRLEAGVHTVRMRNTDGRGLNLDYLALVPESK